MRNEKKKTVTVSKEKTKMTKTEKYIKFELVLKKCKFIHLISFTIISPSLNFLFLGLRKKLEYKEKDGTLKPHEELIIKQLKKI